MAKGFTDSSGKFRPTGNNGTSSRSKSVSTSGMSMNEMKGRDHTGFCPVCNYEITRGSEQEVKQHIKDHIKMREHEGHQGVCNCGIENETKEEKPKFQKPISQMEMQKELEKFLYHPSIAGTVNEFQGNYPEDEEEEEEDESGLWVSGEEGNYIGGKDGDDAFAYWAESDDYDGGIHNKMRKFLDDRGWWAEWHDAGTVMLYKD